MVANKTYMLCDECNYIRIHGMTRFEAALKKKKEDQAQLRQNKKKVVKTTPYKRKKATGEWEMFLQIWEERAHYCQNRNCRKYLGFEPQPIFFSHRKSKGAYPELRLCKDNIDLLCRSCHEVYEFGDKTKLDIL